jgi:hypothetical protein
MRDRYFIRRTPGLIILPPPSGPSSLFRGGQNQNVSSSSPVITFTPINMGTGSQFVILGIGSQGVVENSVTITSVTVNGTALENVVNDASLGGADFIYSGTVTATGSDVVVITYSASVAFTDTNIGVWTATGLTSTTPLTSKSYTQTTTVPAAAGNLLFALTTGGATSFTSPTGITNETAITGANGEVTQPAAVTVTSGMISGGDVTVTISADLFGVVAIWD